MGWPAHLGDTLLQDVNDNYAPELFDDAPAFLEGCAGPGTLPSSVNNPRLRPTPRSLA